MLRAHSFGVTAGNLTVFCRILLGTCDTVHIFCMKGINCNNCADNIRQNIIQNTEELATRRLTFVHYFWNQNTEYILKGNIYTCVQSGHHWGCQHYHDAWSRIFNLLKADFYSSHRQFEHSKVYFLSAMYFCLLNGSQNKKRLLPYTALTDWFLRITGTECVYCAVRTEYLNTVQVNITIYVFRAE
jgi:hypothetical protein